MRFNINYEDVAKQPSSHQGAVSKAVSMPDFRRADWESIKAHLSDVEWDNVFAQCCSCDDLAIRFYNVLYETIEKCVPFTSCASSHGTRVNMRHSAKVRKLERKKRELWRRLKQFNTPELVSKYRDSCKNYHTAIAAAQSQYENNLIESGDLSRFFRYAKSKFTGKKNVASLLCDNGQFAYEPADKANVLSKTFSDMFTTDDGRDCTIKSRANHGFLNNVDFSPSSLKQAIKKN